MTAPTPAPSFRRSRVSLQTKLVVGLIVILLTPLIVSFYVVDNVDRMAARFAQAEADRRIDAMRDAQDAYPSLARMTKDRDTEVLRRIALDPKIAALDPAAPLADIVAREDRLVSLAIVGPGDATIAQASRPVPSGWKVYQPGDEPLSIELPKGGRLVAGFIEDESLRAHYQELHAALDAAQHIAKARSSLPQGYQYAFFAIAGGAVLIAIALGVFASRRITTRVGALLEATRAVSSGRMDVRAALRGRDEMAELGAAFDVMLDDLEGKRAQIEYLQRIGAWQDVARKLAHEIKNPLTPIQLAVQQTVSSYRGDDERYRKQLDETKEIVEEEIAGLRRLVDTFRTLGALPKVEPAPIALADVVEDLKLDPQLAPHLRVRAPDAPVTVRADKLLLKRVLSNLVENGVHAAQEAGASPEVEVSWRAEPVAPGGARVVTIFVDDHGPGVPVESHAKIFEPYVTTKATGTGLGLAISKKIALEHDGDLRISDDRAPTGGARFVLTLPLA